MALPSRYPCLLLTGMTILLAGCGELAYKRGASAADLAQDKAECRNRGADAAPYEKCIAAKGWVVQNLEELDPVAAIIPTENREPALISGEINNAGGHLGGGDSAQPGRPVQAQSKDPMDKLVIGSWWKAGGSADKLKVTMDECSAGLGDGHQPVVIPGNGAYQVTRALLQCLRQQGWYGVSSK